MNRKAILWGAGVLGSFLLAKVVFGKAAPPPLLASGNGASLFGAFPYRAAPTAEDPEHIEPLDGWAAENIVMVPLPELAKIGGPGAVAWNKRAARQLQGLWRAWDEAGLLPLVKTFAGTYNPRFVRGSTSVLSNHAFGSAFDINAAWNGLGKVPAAEGEEGSVRALVPLAYEWGFGWGGNYDNRPDGMHFEVARLM